MLLLLQVQVLNSRVIAMCHIVVVTTGMFAGKWSTGCEALVTEAAKEAACTLVLRIYSTHQNVLSKTKGSPSQKTGKHEYHRLSTP